MSGAVAVTWSFLTHSAGNCLARRETGRGSGFLLHAVNIGMSLQVSYAGTIFTSRCCSAR